MGLNLKNTLCTLCVLVTAMGAQTHTPPFGQIEQGAQEC